MAKKAQKLEPLSLQEIILRGDAATIRQALEARVQIDTLLEEREAAYRRIAELETQVSEIVGEDGVFPFPAPPLEVASYVHKPAPKKKPMPTPAVVEPAVTAAPTPADEPAGAEDSSADAKASTAAASAASAADDDEAQASQED
jgi:hypothetical protein